MGGVVEVGAAGLWQSRGERMEGVMRQGGRGEGGVVVLFQGM